MLLAEVKTVSSLQSTITQLSSSVHETLVRLEEGMVVLLYKSP